MHYYHQQIEVFLDNDNNFLDFFNPYKKFINYTGNFRNM